jgi:hypothetical protein
VVGAVLAAVLAGGGGEGWAEDLVRDLETVVYDFEVAGYCGLVTDQVAAGFRREYADVLRRDRMSEEEASLARRRAFVAVEAEWGNRGLGGFRGWCREEGRAAAAHFRRNLRDGPPEVE